VSSERTRTSTGSAEQHLRIALLPGDGIGTEVTVEARRVLERIAELDERLVLEFVEFEWGSEYYLAHGTMMPADGLDRLGGFDAILLGAVGDPPGARRRHTLGAVVADPPALPPIRQPPTHSADVRSSHIARSSSTG